MKTVLMIAAMMVLPTMSFAGNLKMWVAKEMTPQNWSDVTSGKVKDIVIEFRSGDEIPFSFLAQGDLLESKNPTPQMLTVKKTFWIKPELSKEQILMSLDNQNFKPFNEVITGSFQVGANADSENSPATGIQAVLNAELRDLSELRKAAVSSKL